MKECLCQAKIFTEEFKVSAVKQINEQGYPVSEVAARLGVSTNSLYAWIKRYQKNKPKRKQDDTLQHEIKRLRQELKRMTEERDIFKKGSRVLCKNVRLKYSFIKKSRPFIRYAGCVWFFASITAVITNG